MTALTDLYATLPALDCKGLCARSCGPIMAEIPEANACGADYAIVAFGGREVAAFSFDRKKRCNLLRYGRCTAYDARPAICRLWGLVEGMRCMYGCVPERYLTDAEGHDFLRAVREACAPLAEPGSGGEGHRAKEQTRLASARTTEENVDASAANPSSPGSASGVEVAS